MDYSAFLKKNKLHQFDWVSVQANGETIEGKLLPGENHGTISLKLKTGYNMGISIDHIQRIERMGEHAAKQPNPFPPLKRKEGLPNISILHTGGTIASRVDYETGGVKASISPESLAQLVPELSNIANFDYKLLANIMSEDLRFSHDQLMARTISKESGTVDGVIVTHGTDTLCYTAATLSFMLENIPIPVLLIGSQRSSDRGSSDAASNLLCAAAFIAKTDFAGVAICMHESTGDGGCVILPATRTRKMHTSRRDAFKAINGKPIARVTYPTMEVELLTDDYAKRKTTKLELKEKMEEKVAILRTHPNMDAKTFEFFFDIKHFKGVVLEATGIGQAPTNIAEH